MLLEYSDFHYDADDTKLFISKTRKSSELPKSKDVQICNLYLLK